VDTCGPAVACDAGPQTYLTALDDCFIRPGCLARAAWLLRPLPGGVWLGFAVGKAAADVAWYGMEASARWVVTRSIAGPPAATCQPGDTPLPA